MLGKYVDSTTQMVLPVLLLLKAGLWVGVGYTYHAQAEDVSAATVTMLALLCVDAVLSGGLEQLLATWPRRFSQESQNVSCAL